MKYALNVLTPDISLNCCERITGKAFWTGQSKALSFLLKILSRDIAKLQSKAMFIRQWDVFLQLTGHCKKQDSRIKHFHECGERPRLHNERERRNRNLLTVILFSPSHTHRNAADLCKSVLSFLRCDMFYSLPSSKILSNSSAPERNYAIYEFELFGCA